MVGSHQEDILEDTLAHILEDTLAHILEDILAHILEDMLAEENFGAMKEPDLQSILTSDFVFKFRFNLFEILRARQKCFDKQKHGNTKNININIYENMLITLENYL